MADAVADVDILPQHHEPSRGQLGVVKLSKEKPQKPDWQQKAGKLGGWGCPATDLCFLHCHWFEWNSKATKTKPKQPREEAGKKDDEEATEKTKRSRMVEKVFLASLFFFCLSWLWGKVFRRSKGKLWLSKCSNMAASSLRIVL